MSPTKVNHGFLIAAICAGALVIAGCGGAGHSGGSTTPLSASALRQRAQAICTQVDRPLADAMAQFGAASETRKTFVSYLSTVIAATRAIDAQLTALHGPASLTAAFAKVISDNRRAVAAEQGLTRSLSTQRRAGRLSSAQLDHATKTLRVADSPAAIEAASANIPSACASPQ